MLPCCTSGRAWRSLRASPPSSRRTAATPGSRRCSTWACRIAAGDADVVIGDDSEMTRLLEGGTAVLGYRHRPRLRPVGLRRRLPHGGVCVGLWRRHGPGRNRRARGAHAARPDGRDAAARDDGCGGPAAAPRMRWCPLSLAGAGEPSPRRRALRLMATAAEIAGSRNGPRARGFLAFLGLARPSARRSLPAPGRARRRRRRRCAAADVYGRAVLDWWLPECSLTRNGHNDPQQSVGPPDAVRLEPDRYRGLISLGQGGYVTVELSEPAADGPGADIRVFQTTTNEPVTVYASVASQGPFVLLGLRRSCGIAHPGRVLESLRLRPPRRRPGARPDTSRSRTARSTPAWPRGTLTEGADLDAVQALNR